MKTKLLFFFLILLPTSLFSQVPQGLNYQAIARDGSGNPLISKEIQVRVSILSDTTGFYSYSYLIPIINLGKGGDGGSKGIEDFLPIRPITPISTNTRSFSRANIATGQYSVAIGNGNTTQNGGLVFGSNSDALQFGALALGTSSAANQSNSVSIGYNTTANGIYSVALGNNITVNSYGELGLGQWSETVTGTANSWNENDLLFSLGNGVNDANRSNAMTIYKNGKRRSAVIGKAVESFSGTETGKIMVLISLQ